MMYNHAFYSNHTIDQFAADEFFQQWVLQADDASNTFWNGFLAAYPGSRKQVQKARQLVELSAHAAYGTSPLTTKEKKALKDNIFSSLDLSSSLTAPRNAIIRKIVWVRAAAAVFILAVLSIFLIYRVRPGAGKNELALLSEHTGPNEVKRIMLADSTLIILNANSILHYSPDLAATREVTLEGNAFFDVKKDHGRRPFVVHTNTADITVLGTTFNADARSAAAEVVLTSGKVKMTLPGQQQSPVYLLPGDKVTLDTIQHSFVKSTADISLYSEWMNGKWTFRHNTLEDIAGLITKYYGVEVQFRSAKSKRLRINAVIPVGSLQKLIPVLAQTVHKKMNLSEQILVIE